MGTVNSRLITNKSHETETKKKSRLFLVSWDFSPKTQIIIEFNFETILEAIT